MSTAVVELPLLRRDVEWRPGLCAAHRRRAPEDGRHAGRLLGAAVHPRGDGCGARHARYFVGQSRRSHVQDMFVLAAVPSALLLPIVGILLVSSEWISARR